MANDEEYLKRHRKRLVRLYVIYKMTGMLPMQFSHRLKPHASDVWYTAAYVVVYMCICAYSAATFPAAATQAPEPRFVVVLWAGVVAGCQLLMFVFAFLYRAALVRGVNQLGHLDNLLEQLRIPIDYVATSSLRWILAMVTFVIVRWIAIAQIVDMGVPQMCTTFMAIFAKTVCKYQFATLFAPVVLRYRRINAAVEELTRARWSATSRARLRQLTRAHFKLCNVCRIIRDALSFTLLLSLIQTVVEIFQHTFYLYLALTKGCQRCGTVHYLCPVLLLLGESVETVYLVRTCVQATDEANRIGSLLHKLRRFVDATCAKDIYSYSIECLHQHVNFDLAGVVVLDYNMLYMFVQAFSTYFIISIQFYETHRADNESDSS